jgi:hypothetical protein
MKDKENKLIPEKKVLNEEQINNLILDLEKEVNLVIKRLKDGK